MACKKETEISTKEYQTFYGILSFAMLNLWTTPMMSNGKHVVGYSQFRKKSTGLKMLKYILTLRDPLITCNQVLIDKRSWGSLDSTRQQMIVSILSSILLLSMWFLALQFQINFINLSLISIDVNKFNTNTKRPINILDLLNIFETRWQCNFCEKRKKIEQN